MPLLPYQAEAKMKAEQAAREAKIKSEQEERNKKVKGLQDELRAAAATEDEARIAGWFLFL